jgi:GXWXG protein
MIPASQPALRLHQLESGTTTEAALAFFDSLSPVEIATMIGAWRGRGVETGHPIDGLLERFGWHGKRFTGPDGAHPLVFEGSWRIQRKSRDDPDRLRDPPCRSIPAPAGRPAVSGI